MEEAPAAELYRNARHPYTKLLFSSVSGAGLSLPEAGVSAGASAGTGTKDRASLDTGSLSPGCPFAPRCTEAEERCFREHPEIGEMGTGHRIRCFKPE
jgi:peptide/nickel transport system ATP-binding protein/oligopeptide transport system ATP-binding protein